MYGSEPSVDLMTLPLMTYHSTQMVVGSVLMSRLTAWMRSDPLAPLIANATAAGGGAAMSPTAASAAAAAADAAVASSETAPSTTTDGGGGEHDVALAVVTNGTGASSNDPSVSSPKYAELNGRH